VAVDWVLADAAFRLGHDHRDSGSKQRATFCTMHLDKGRQKGITNVVVEHLQRSEDSQDSLCRTGRR